MTTHESVIFSAGDYHIQIGLELRAGDMHFRIADIVEDTAILKSNDLDRRKVIPIQKLLTSILNGQFIAVALNGTPLQTSHIHKNEDDYILSRLPLDELSESQREHVLKAMRYINGLRNRGYKSCNPKSPGIQLEISRLASIYKDEEPPTVYWIYRWSLRLDRAHGDPRAVIPRNDLRGGPRQHRTPKEVEDAIECAIGIYRNDDTSPLRIKDIHDTASDILLAKHPDRPDLALRLSRSTVARRTEQSFSSYERCVRNKGKAFADRQYRDWYPRERAEFPLEVFETDDTDTRIFLIDELTGLPCGRGHLTGVNDQNTGVHMGWDLSEQPRSVFSAINAIVCAILPKDPAHKDFLLCDHPPEFYGKSGIIVFDNALYNHSDQIELAAHDIGFMPGWAKPKTPTEKSVIEGWFGILKKEFLPTLPGYRGSKKEPEGLSHGLKTANLGLRTFRQLFLKWVFDDYSNNPMTRDGLTPRQRWHANMRLSKPRIPVDIHGLRIVACIRTTTTLKPEGIRLFGIIYTSPSLKLLRRLYGVKAKVQCRYNPHNLGEIYVFDQVNKQYIPIPAEDQVYSSGLTLYQHKLIRKLARDLGKRNPAIAELMKCRADLRMITKQLRTSKKLRDRKRAARTGEIPATEQSESMSSTPVVEMVTELEYSVSEISDISLDTSDEGWTIPEDF